MDQSHISFTSFISIIQQRLLRYADAIWLPGGRLSIVSAIQYNVEKLQRLNTQDNFCGRGFWGYGINCICDGKDRLCYPDIEEIKKLNILNKHLEPFRNLQVLTFKIEGRYLYVSTFSIDSCRTSIVSTINTKYDLRNFDNARLATRNNKTYVEFILNGLQEPISFQIDDYHFPVNLSGDRLARYYIESIKLAAAPYVVEETSNISDAPDFVEDFIKGIQSLQSQGSRLECIRKLIAENKKDEAGFRDFFQIVFDSKGYSAEPETLKANGRIDLKVTYYKGVKKIIEFKGWWNEDKKDIINQLHSYLTEFEGDGYIFMINHTKRTIVDEYKKLITDEEMRFISDSWDEIAYRDTAYTYYKSKHSFIRIKTVYHFIYSVYD